MKPSYRRERLVATAVLLGTGLLIFWPFVFGDGILLYRDIGSDSLISYYPEFVHLSDYLRHSGLPSWSFYVGIGQDISYLTGYLLWEPATWLPHNWIARALIYQHLFKVVLTGLIFFSYLRLLQLTRDAALLGSLLLSFSAYMCMGSCWYPFADEVLCFATFLLAIERILVSGRWLLLVAAAAMVGAINPFYLYLSALFLALYVPLRLYLRHGWQSRFILQTFFKLSGIAALGYGLGAVVTLPFLHVILESPRGSGSASYAGVLSAHAIFVLESGQHYATWLLRFFSNDMAGAGDYYHGWRNYLEAPLSYAGLLPLLLLPQAFYLGQKRARLLLVFLLAAIGLPSFFSWFRYLFWLFQGDYFRTYSLFCVLGLVIVAAFVFSAYANGRRLSYPVLIATLALLIGVLYLPWHRLQSLINPELRIWAIIYLTLYTTLLATGQYLQRARLVSCIVLGVVVIKLVQFDRITVSDRQFLTRHEMRERKGYNDETVEAVRDIKAADSSAFYRISKPRPSAPSSSFSLNDSLIFSYYGTSSYSSFNNVNYTDFLRGADAMPDYGERSTRWAIGTLDYPLLSAFLGEKYALVDNVPLYEKLSQYRLLKTYAQDGLFVNSIGLPLGVTFNQCIDEEAFEALGSQMKSEALLRAVVLPKGEGGKPGLNPLGPMQLADEVNSHPLSSAITARTQSALELTSFGQSRITGRLATNEPVMLVIQTAFARGWRAVVNGKRVPVQRVDNGLLGLPIGSGENKVELSYRNPFLLPGLGLTLLSLTGIILTWRLCPRLAPVHAEEACRATPAAVK